MVIVKLMGGLGNQMFQYAAALRVAYQTGEKLKLDIRHYDIKQLPNGLPYRSFDLTIFELKPNFASQQEIDRFLGTPKSFSEKVIRKIHHLAKPHRYLLEPHFHFYEDLLYINGNIYLEGYWQCERYFKDIEQIIKSEFKIKTDHSDLGIQILRDIKSTQSVCLNIRRQEFASGRYPNQFVGLEYIEKGIELIRSKVPRAKFYIFSDELSWVEENLKLDETMTIVQTSLYGDKFRNCLDLMQNCKHFIIPNSSFGWWAAWLSTNPHKIVIVPNIWLTDSSKNTDDLIPEGWIRI